MTQINSGFEIFINDTINLDKFKHDRLYTLVELKIKWDKMTLSEREKYENMINYWNEALKSVDKDIEYTKVKYTCKECGSYKYWTPYDCKHIICFNCSQNKLWGNCCLE